MSNGGGTRRGGGAPRFVSASVTRVPRPRGEIDPADLRRIRKAMAGREKAQAELEQAVLDALDHGASFRVLTEATGIAGTTLQAWKRKH